MLSNSYRRVWFETIEAKKSYNLKSMVAFSKIESETTGMASPPKQVFNESFKT